MQQGVCGEGRLRLRARGVPRARDVAPTRTVCSALVAAVSREVGAGREDARPPRTPRCRCQRGEALHCGPARSNCSGRSMLRGLFRPLERAVSDIGAMQVRSQSELRRSKTPVLLSRGARDRMGWFWGGGSSVRASINPRSVCQTGVIIRLSMRLSFCGDTPRPDVLCGDSPRREVLLGLRLRCGFQCWGICSSEPTGGARRSPRESASARREQAFARRMSIC
jgi:hypothetical protein